jgi:pre-mRNA-splicing helicase BRR2
VEGIFDLVEMEDDDRKELLKRFNQTELKDIARVCNLYPNVEITHEIKEEEIYQGNYFLDICVCPQI